MNHPRYRLPSVGAPVVPAGQIPGAFATGHTRVIVTGSREWQDEAAVRTALTRSWREAGQPLVVIHGACPTGADRIASEWAREHEYAGITEEPWPAKWKLYGRRAGPQRNAEMVAAGAALCLAFPFGQSSGTRHAMRCARAAGIPVHDFDPALTVSERSAG